MQSTTKAVITIILAIKEGSVMSYGEIAACAGLVHGARQVARILHTMSRTHKLPWWRVVKAGDRLALPKGSGFEEQKALLQQEGWTISEAGILQKTTTG